MRSKSESCISHSTGSLLNSRKLWSTMNDLQQTSRQDIFGIKRKSVMFSARVHVVLIPSITEYETAGLASLMWWTDDDYRMFKQYALEEVKDFMLRFKILDSKEAIRRLYQYPDDSNSTNPKCCTLKLNEFDDNHFPSLQEKNVEVSTKFVDVAVNGQESMVGVCGKLMFHQHDKGDVAYNVVNESPFACNTFDDYHIHPLALICS